MNDSPEASTTERPGSGTWGWYLYGIVRDDEEPGVDAGESTRLDDTESLEGIAQGSVRAVVRRVPLADFAPEAIQAHASDPAWLEHIARQHNDVISTIHERRTILPAKFGAVYTSREDLRAALAENHETLRSRLNGIDGCDEWGIHLYGDPATIREHAVTDHAGVARLREELASASPGRAFFLQRKLEEELARATDSALDDLVDQAYRRLAEHAVSARISARAAAERIAQREGEVEVMRAVFLVRRTGRDAFLDGVRAISDSEPGLRCEYSGPWPAYSFAAEMEETQ